MEIGFWDYTCPNQGTIERYDEQDYVRLFDDMVKAGMDSFVLGIKWVTTGYYSRLEWLDQMPGSSAIESKNEIIRFALREARARGIKTRLLVVSTIFPPENFGLPALWVPECNREFYGLDVGYYDLDLPGLKERIFEMFGEIIDLFGDMTDGFVVELEFCDAAEPHRIPIYDAWAKENGRPSYAEMMDFKMQPRTYPQQHWRDFATERRVVFLNALKTFIRGQGFQGELSTIYEIHNDHQLVIGSLNLNMMAKGIQPDYDLVTYDGVYTRTMNRESTIELCITHPMESGFKTYYITRGVMTFCEWLYQSLTDEWDMSLEDAYRAKPDGLWFMGADCAAPGKICRMDLLQRFGFSSGLEARQALLSRVRERTGK